MAKKKLLSVAVSALLLAATVSPAAANLAPNQRLANLTSAAVAGAETEQYLALPRMFAADNAWKGRYGCTPIVFIGARGSDEHPVSDDLAFSSNTAKTFSDDVANVQLGETLTDLISKTIASRLPVRGPSLYSYRGVGPVANMSGYGAHSALNDFFGMLSPYVAQGSKAAAATILQVADSCPKSKFVLIGYSQGAAVIRAAASKLSDTSADFFNTKVLATVLVGDPTSAASFPLNGDSLAAALNAAHPGSITPKAGTCTDVAIGTKCIDSDGFVATFGTGAWGTNSSYRPPGWPLKGTGDTGSATVIPNSGSLCIQRDIICNASVVQSWNPGLGFETLVGHALYAGEQTSGVAGFRDVLATWLAGKGVFAATKPVVTFTGPSIKKSVDVASTLRVCPNQGASTLAISNDLGLPARDGSLACNFIASDVTGAVTVEVARSRSELNSMSKARLTTLVGAKALEVKKLPKTGTNTFYLRVTNAIGRATVVKLSLIRW